MKKGSCELPWIIHINRAFELQFGGDDLVRQINRSTQCTYGYVKVLHFLSQWNCEVFSWKFHYEWSLSLIRSHLWTEFLLAEKGLRTAARISKQDLGADISAIEKLSLRRDRADNKCGLDPVTGSEELRDESWSWSWAVSDHKRSGAEATDDGDIERVWVISCFRRGLLCSGLKLVKRVSFRPGSQALIKKSSLFFS